MLKNRLYPRLVELGRESVQRLADHPVAGRLLGGRLCRDEYAGYLVQVVHQVRGSDTYLAQAGRSFERLERADLAQLLGKKSGEEKGHHHWALDDLAELGFRADVVERAPPSQAVQAYNAWARFASEHEPFAVLGLAFMLEWFGYACAGDAARNLVARSGIARIDKAVTFLLAHGEADVEHIRVLSQALDTIDDPAEAELVLMSARLTARLYVGFFEDSELLAPAA